MDAASITAPDSMRTPGARVVLGGSLLSMLEGWVVVDMGGDVGRDVGGDKKPTDARSLMMQFSLSVRGP